MPPPDFSWVVTLGTAAVYVAIVIVAVLMSIGVAVVVKSLTKRRD